MSDSLIADVTFPLITAPDTKKPLQAQIRFACEDGYHPSISVHSLIDKSEIDTISLVFGTSCSLSSKDHHGLRTLRLDFFPPFAGQRDVSHVRPASLLASHLKLQISFSDREKCALFARVIKDALLQKALLKHQYTAELQAPIDDHSSTVMYAIKVSKPSSQVTTISRRFTDFKKLHDQLGSLGIPVRKLPGKDWKAVVSSKKHDPERLAAKATKLGRFIDSICSHERTAKLPVVIEFLSLDSGAESSGAAIGNMSLHDSPSSVAVSISKDGARADVSASGVHSEVELRNVCVSTFSVLKDTHDGHTSEYVDYEIAVTYQTATTPSETVTKTLHKRFSDFRRLQKDLEAEEIQVPMLPGKAWLVVTHKAKFDANRLHVKQGNLSQFLAECAKSEAIHQNAIFLEFCGLGKSSGLATKAKPRIDTDMAEAKKLRRAGKWAECYQLYLQCAEEGNSEAQAWVGHCLINAKGVSRDEAKAVGFFKQSAESGLSMAQVKLGACFEQGIGVAKNAVEAVKWYRLSADQNNSAAQYSLGVCLYEGIGCARDVDQAIRLLESSRDLGVDQAKVALQRIQDLRDE
jgi:hypothetical protein